MHQLKLAVLLSGGGTTLQNFLDRIGAGELDAEVVAVGSGRKKAYGLRRANRHAVPTFVDAAAEEPNAPNFYLESGADVVCYSGGKCLRGPQSAGFVLGRKDICMAAARNLSPYGGLGRAQKVGKEEIVGVPTALDLWVHGRDHDAEYKEWGRRLDYISEQITKIEGVTTEIVKPGRPSNVAPTMSISWDEDKLELTREEFDRRLLAGYPRIKIASYTGDASHSPAAAIRPYQMRPGDEIPVARRMFELLSQQET